MFMSIPSNLGPTRVATDKSKHRLMGSAMTGAGSGWKACSHREKWMAINYTGRLQLPAWTRWNAHPHLRRSVWVLCWRTTLWTTLRTGNSSSVNYFFPRAVPIRRYGALSISRSVGCAELRRIYLLPGCTRIVTSRPGHVRVACKTCPCCSSSGMEQRATAAMTAMMITVLHSQQL